MPPPDVDRIAVHARDADALQPHVGRAVRHRDGDRPLARLPARVDREVGDADVPTVQRENRFGRGLRSGCEDRGGARPDEPGTAAEQEPVYLVASGPQADRDPTPAKRRERVPEPALRRGREDASRLCHGADGDGKAAR